MPVGTYGEHAENAAAALNELIRADAIPSEPASVDRLIHCREAVVDALRQRLFDVGLNSWYPNGIPPAAPGVNLAAIDNKLATLLNNIAFTLPNLPAAERLSPVEVLGEPVADSVVETWREAAVELLAATHALDAAGDKPWLRDRGASWYLVRDVAVALEAVLVLDARLAEVGLLSQHDQLDSPMGLEEMRLIASQAARVATWYATSDAPDVATPRTAALSSNILYPVATVAAPEDLAAAQDRLAGFLRPFNTLDPLYSGEPQISADSARHITASQLHLCRVFAEMAARSPRTAVFVSFFGERAEILESLQPQVRYLVEVRSHEPNIRRFWQQGELTSAISRMKNHRIELKLQPHQMLALANATHEVTRNLGLSLRRELLRSTSNLRNANPRHGPMRVGRRSKLEATLTDLVHMQAPRAPVAQFTSPLQRAALRQTLDLTPTAPRSPSPYPAAPSIAAPDAPAH
jgi:hypothetical protein